jgi:hypothetical protein
MKCKACKCNRTTRFYEYLYEYDLNLIFVLYKITLDKYAARCNAAGGKYYNFPRKHSIIRDFSSSQRRI